MTHVEAMTANLSSDGLLQRGIPAIAPWISQRLDHLNASKECTRPSLASSNPDATISKTM
jgi:hypothetical protein